MTKVCPHCWRNVRVLKSGVFGVHTPSSSTRFVCEGSFKPWITGQKLPKLLAWPYPKVGTTISLSDGYSTRYVDGYVQINGELFAYISGYSGSAFILAEKLNQNEER